MTDSAGHGEIRLTSDMWLTSTCDAEQRFSSCFTVEIESARGSPFVGSLLLRCDAVIEHASVLLSECANLCPGILQPSGDSILLGLISLHHSELAPDHAGVQERGFDRSEAIIVLGNCVNKCLTYAMCERPPLIIFQDATDQAEGYLALSL